jgi:hypothetical protein
MTRSLNPRWTRPVIIGSALLLGVFEALALARARRRRLRRNVKPLALADGSAS